jgi:ATP synthase protein I
MNPKKQSDFARDDTTVAAARQATERSEAGKHDPEPSLGTRFGQIGVLGWAIVVPILIGLIIGRYLDQLLSTGIMFAAAFIMIGAIVGMWSAWKWMHRT